MKTSGLTLWVLVAVVSCLIIISGIVMYFKWREKKQDQKEKEDISHLFNYDAL